jgi:phosphinothricin acetyltransferase
VATGEPTIRAATSADVPAINALMNALITTTTIEWTETPHTVEATDDWLEDHECVLVAEIGTDGGREVVGVAAYRWFSDVVARPGYRFTVENTIHVRGDQWGSGVGRALMTALLDAARAAGLHTMVAAIDGANEASLRFHERLGFVEVARMPEVGEKFGRWLDLVLLQIHLDDRATPIEPRTDEPTS